MDIPDYPVSRRATATKRWVETLLPPQYGDRMRRPQQHPDGSSDSSLTRRIGTRRRRTALLLGALLAVTIVGSGCANNAGSSTTEPALDRGVVGSEPLEPGSPGIPDSGTGDSGASDSSAGLSQESAVEPAEDPAFSTDRQVISTGYATVTADDPLEASGEAVDIVEAAGGRVDARSEQAPTNGDNGSVTLTLRIPADTFSDTLDELTALGRNVSVETQANDVTTQTQDLDARINALTASVDRLLALLATAQDTAVLIELETAISARQGELDSLQAQRRSLEDQVSMSTLTLTLVSEADVPGETPQTFWDALVAGAAALGAFFSGAFLALGYALPWLAAVAIGVLLILLVIRRRRTAKTTAEKTAAEKKTAEKRES
jgi:hypothetical protein